MKRLVAIVMGAVVILFLGGAAFAWMGGGAMGAGPMGHMMGAGPMGAGPMGRMMGAGPMRGPMMGAAGGSAGCPGMTAAGVTAEAVTEEQAKALAQTYADKYLQGFTVEKVLPFTGQHGTGYSVELKGPKDEVRVLHVNPFGGVMPFGGPGRRTAG